jgi:hypothetical protein
MGCIAKRANIEEECRYVGLEEEGNKSLLGALAAVWNKLVS